MKRILLLLSILMVAMSGQAANVAFNTSTLNVSPTNLNFLRASNLIVVTGFTNSGTMHQVDYARFVSPINSPSSAFDVNSRQMIIGGQQHVIVAGLAESVIYGGFNNTIAAGGYSAIVGGDRNTIATNAVTAFIGGGQQNRVTFNSASIAGLENAVDGDSSFIAGGQQCLITANAGRGTILSSDTSSITGPGGGDYYCILPGLDNNIAYALSSDDFCYILGGRGNRVTKAESWAIGMFITNTATRQIELGYDDLQKVRITPTNFATIGGLNANFSGNLSVVSNVTSGPITVSGSILPSAGNSFTVGNAGAALEFLSMSARVYVAGDSTTTVGFSKIAAAHAAIGTAVAGNIAGTVTTSNLLLAGSCTVTQAFANGVVAVALTADNQSVSVTNRSYIQLSSDDGTAGNRTFVLSSGFIVGQAIDLEWTGTNAGEMADDASATGGGNIRLSATWTPTQYDVLALRWNGTDWIERHRSTN